MLLVEPAVESRLAEIRHSVPNLFSLDAGVSGLEGLASVAPPAGFDFEASWTAVAPEDLAALIYTSGTTGPAKGVEWTHRAAVGSLSGFDEACGEEDGIHDVCFASLAERFGGHWHALLRGSSRAICEDPTQLGAALLDARPTRLGGPPQFWQRLKRGLEATLDPGDAEACATVAAAIAAVNAHSEPRERIEAHAIVAEAWLPGAELTETLKLRRRWIAEKYADEIEGLYGRAQRASSQLP